MPYNVEIRRNSDGVIHTYRDDFDWSGDYIWAAGNYSCDCNRRLFFGYAVGEEPEEVECGDGAYSVRCVSDDGKELYKDDSWTQTPETQD